MEEDQTTNYADLQASIERASEDVEKRAADLAAALWTQAELAEFGVWWSRTKSALDRIKQYSRSKDPAQRRAAELARRKLDASDIAIIESWMPARQYRGTKPGSGFYSVDDFAEHSRRVASGERSRTVARDIVRRLRVNPQREDEEARAFERAAKRWAKRGG